MSIQKSIRKGITRINRFAYHLLDTVYLPLDRKQILRAKNISHIPVERHRRGGKYSYAEWAHVIGIFQTLIYIHLDKKENNLILDIGCGTGFLGLASESFLGEQGAYVGMDVMKLDIEFCRGHYPSNFEFKHLDLNNPAYAPEQNNTTVPWPLENKRFDLVTALSVWTHLKEEDALFYFKEIERILKPGGKAIVTFFLIDETYEQSLAKRSDCPGRYHMTSQDLWIFDKPSYGSDNWFHPGWAQVPELAIGVTKAGLDRLTSHAGLRLTDHYQGNWKEIPGVYFQDVLVFQKD